MDDVAHVLEYLYEKHDYLEAYSRHTDLRVASDPHEAIGGMWDELGMLQFRFLQQQGLEAHHRLLDFGCGTMRGGRHFISYLQQGSYCGVDISASALAYAQQLIQTERLENKSPYLFLDHDQSMMFDRLGVASFEFLIAHSVFTHLKVAHINQCLENIKKVMNGESRFFFTYLEFPMHKGRSYKDFYYSPVFFEKMADKHGYSLVDRTLEYTHPRSQRMVELRLN